MKMRTLVATMVILAVCLSAGTALAQTESVQAKAEERFISLTPAEIEDYIRSAKDSDTSWSMRRPLIEFLGVLPGERFAELLSEIALNEYGEACITSLEMLGNRPEEIAVRTLVRKSFIEDRDIYRPAIESLGKHSSPEVTRALWILFLSRYEGRSLAALELLKGRAEAEGFEISRDLDWVNERFYPGYWWLRPESWDEYMQRRLPLIGEVLDFWTDDQFIQEALGTPFGGYVIPIQSERINRWEPKRIASIIESNPYKAVRQEMFARLKGLSHSTQTLLQLASNEDSVIQDSAFYALSGRSADSPEVRKALLDNADSSSVAMEVLLEEWKSWDLGTLVAIPDTYPYISKLTLATEIAQHLSRQDQVDSIGDKACRIVTSLKLDEMFFDGYYRSGVPDLFDNMVLYPSPIVDKWLLALDATLASKGGGINRYERSLLRIVRQNFEQRISRWQYSEEVSTDLHAQAASSSSGIRMIVAEHTGD